MILTACSKSKNVHQGVCIKAISSFMLCSFGISTEASAPGAFIMSVRNAIAALIFRMSAYRKTCPLSVASLLSS